ncbi:MAG: DUF815 domain-containing protein, partial [Hyphomicrobiaceae bacterium]|nr:DUF815 domain-containing protein [Hyphomicrobiaceae bacterium]
MPVPFANAYRGVFRAREGSCVAALAKRGLDRAGAIDAHAAPLASEPWGTSLSEEALKSIAEQLALLVRHAERTAPPLPSPPDFDAADAFVWQPAGHRLQPVTRVSRVDLSLLRGVDRMRDILLDNTERFARGLPANNVLLWGAR